MKKSILVLTTAVAMIFASCKEKPYINEPGDNSQNYGSIPVIVDPEPTPDPAGADVPEGAITANEAVNIAKSLKSEAVTDKEYYIKGWVHSFDAKQQAKEDYEKNFCQYGNDYVYLSAREDGLGSKLFYCYRITGINGGKLPDHESLVIGDFVVVKCKITNYKGTYESSGTCSMYSSTNEHMKWVTTWKGCPTPGEGEISMNDAKAIADTLADEATTTGTYKIRCVVTRVNTYAADLPKYGNASFDASSDGQVFGTCFQLNYKTASGKFTSTNQIAIGDTVLVQAKIQNYHGTVEPKNGFVVESTNPNF